MRCLFIRNAITLSYAVLVLLSDSKYSTRAWTVKPVATKLNKTGLQSSCNQRNAKFPHISVQKRTKREENFDPLDVTPSNSFVEFASNDDSNNGVFMAAAVYSALLMMTFPTEASAITTSFTTSYATAANALTSALAAYGHYVSLMGMVACVSYERFKVEPNMSADEENRVAIADTLYGVFGTLLVITGYYRVTEYGKGWEFYSHEPIFWLKLTFLGIVGAASFFNTVKITQRAIERQQGQVEFVPLSEKLAARIIQLCNAQIVGLATIPLTATLMARGVFYNENIPWELEAALFALTFGGLSYKYINEALTWEED